MVASPLTVSLMGRPFFRERFRADCGAVGPPTPVERTHACAYLAASGEHRLDQLCLAEIHRGIPRSGSMTDGSRSYRWWYSTCPANDTGLVETTAKTSSQPACRWRKAMVGSCRARPGNPWQADTPPRRRMRLGVVAVQIVTVRASRATERVLARIARRQRPVARSNQRKRPLAAGS